MWQYIAVLVAVHFVLEYQIVNQSYDWLGRLSKLALPYVDTLLLLFAIISTILSLNTIISIVIHFIRRIWSILLFFFKLPFIPVKIMRKLYKKFSEYILDVMGFKYYHCGEIPSTWNSPKGRKWMERYSKETSQTRGIDTEEFQYSSDGKIYRRHTYDDYEKDDCGNYTDIKNFGSEVEVSFWSYPWLALVSPYCWKWLLKKLRWWLLLLFIVVIVAATIFYTL